MCDISSTGYRRIALEKDKKRKCTKQDGLYQYRFTGENLRFWKSMLGEDHKSTKLLVDILTTIQYYHKNNPQILITFFGISFYERYFGHIDINKGENTK